MDSVRTIAVKQIYGGKKKYKIPFIKRQNDFKNIVAAESIQTNMLTRNLMEEKFG